VTWVQTLTRLAALGRATKDRLDLAAELGAVALLAVAVLIGRVVRSAVGQVALPVLIAVHRLAQEYALPPSARVAPEHAAPRRGGRGTGRLALASVAALLLGLVAAATSPPDASPVRVVTTAAQLQTAQPERSPLLLDDGVDAVPARPEGRAWLPEPAPAATSVPLPTMAEPTPAPAPPPAPTRWLPTGTGMWLHDWVNSEGGSAPAVVSRAQASGLTHLYVQTGSTKKGWIGEQVLSELLPATVGTDLKVIAWDFPKLIDPEADALRMAAAATWSRPGVPQVAAVAPDVETSAEGTRLSPDAVSRYYATLRAALPPQIAVLATVPWPSEKRTGSYPYAETAVHSDAFVPMAYWYNRSPTVVTTTSMQYLAQFGLPVMPVGQGYDGRIDAPNLPEDPDPAGSVQQFVDAARSGGAASISLWSWQTTPALQWDVLARASAGPWTPTTRGVPLS
jgi:hypothetical protein